MAKYMILGGNGVFGVHCVKYILKNDPKAEVIAVGRNSEKTNAFSLHRGIDDRRYKYAQIHLVFENDRFEELVDSEKPDFIINFAALAADVASSWKYATRFYETNTVSLARMTDRLVGAPWLKRWLQIGSSEVYGAVNKPSTEEQPINPTTPYAVSKAAGDLHLKAIHNVRGFPMNILWPSNAYGPGQQLYRIIPKTILACLLNRKLPLQGGGKAVKSFIHAEDLARSIFLTLHESKPGACYNVGPKEGTAIRSLVELIISRMGKKFDDVVQMAPDRLGQDAQYLLNSTKIKNELGWEPKISLEAGVDDTIAWVKAHLNELAPLSTDVFFQA